ncbi:hypothetical protein Agabi119p4_5219 [Agaricus bisporus var. burnettii]|uniref:DUF6533 domain-containing protein n=1 Tax=Agaricus bisporus var. burnettii TaxID=192524 RepID=A0A8H7F4R1_AGABI|nr:hypothetical protein Agabi119p4_5219 [Agaricus bisporus var. burnettii]
MDPGAVERIAFHLLIGKYFQLGGFVMLVYDHFLTFPQEVERIWKQRFTVASILFLINRYVTILQFIILLLGECYCTSINNGEADVVWQHSTVLTGHTGCKHSHFFEKFTLTQLWRSCPRFVHFEGASTVSLVAIGQLIMILRVFALYERSFRVLAFLMILWLLQIIISSIGLRTGFPVPLPPGLTGCILIGSSPLFPSLWISPLVTDSAIFILTLYRTKRYYEGFASTSPTIVILVRDGSLYFLLIFLVNLMNVLIYFIAEPDFKALGASFSQLLTCTMISRLVLNLRSISSSGYDERDVPQYLKHPSASYRGTSVNRHHNRGQYLRGGSCYPHNQNMGTTSLWYKTLGNLGGNISCDGWDGGGGGVRHIGADRSLHVGVEMDTEVFDDTIPLEDIEHSIILK